jgi:NAD(P)-dependent dehydrogenase (short-subunit alcohol dehydrogenase family)
MESSQAKLVGRHAVVTGGGRGIGAEIARALVEQGAAVTLMGRNAATLEDEAARLRPLGRVHCQAVDLADPESTKAAFASAAKALGPVTILINNAGQAVSAPISKTDLALWNQMLAVNLTGTYLGIQAVLPGMLQAGWGRIVNIASTAALKGYPYVAAYCAAKHGVLGLTRALALELAKKPVTVNAVCPGYTETDIVREALANIQAKTGRSEAEARAELVKQNPQGRLVQPAEVANAVLWLCLPGSESITGQAIAVAGGETM